MHGFRPSEDPARRWNRFCRTGWRAAGAFCVLAFLGWTALFRIAPAPAPAPRTAPGQVTWWWPAPGATALDVRTLWTPAAFALSTPAGFSHALRDARAGLAPPVRAERPAAAYLEDARTFAPLDAPATIRPDAAPAAATVFDPADGAFAPRSAAADDARLEFPAGWEKRLFAGLDPDFGRWTNAAWDARVELRFDAAGVPTTVLLAQGSGLPDVDRRLARAAAAWRLLEPAAPRAGVVAWHAPGHAAGGAP